MSALTTLAARSRVRSVELEPGLSHRSCCARWSVAGNITSMDAFDPSGRISILGFLLILLLLMLFFPLIAALVAPDDRRWTFFFLTFFLLLPGPIGVACAAVANPRPKSEANAGDNRSIQDRISNYASEFAATFDWSNPFKEGGGRKSP